MSKPKTYEVHDILTGELLVKGTAAQCAAELGVIPDTVRAIARGKHNSTKWIVEDLGKDGPDKVFDGNTSLKRAAEEWEQFCRPIRREFGIPVYKAPVKEDEEDE